MIRVAITGLGCVTPIGNDVEQFREALFAGRTGISEFNRAFTGALDEESGLRFRTTARVSNFRAADYLSSTAMAVTAPAAQFGIVAGRQAAAESRLLEHYSPETISIITGCSCGGRDADEDGCRTLYTRNARISPTVILRTMANSGASNIAIELGITGPVYNVSTACASGTHALGLAFHMVRSGMASAAIAGGYEAPLTFGFLRAWDSMRVVSPTQCQPFSKQRDGMTLGEGAAMLVLEPLEAAQARGATIYAEMVGFGMSADASHIAQPQPQGAALAIRRALEDSALSGIPDAADRVGYINAHGTGTPTNDPTEAAAIHIALGDRAAKIPVSGTKSLHGHSIGAVGAIEGLATALALRAGTLPYTAGVTEPDPSFNLDVITGEPRPMEQGKDVALSTSLAFGGLNAVIAMRRYTGA